MRLSLIDIAPPSVDQMRQAGGKGGSDRTSECDPVRGYKTLVAQAMQHVVYQTTMYMETVMKSFFKQAVDRALFISSKDTEAKHVLLSETNGTGFALLRMQLHRAS